MTYVKPTPATFKLRFPEFKPVADLLIQAIIDEQEIQVGPSWFEDDRAPALQYLVAHLLSIQGEPQRSIVDEAGGGSGGGSMGTMKRRKVGDVEVEYQSRAEISGVGVGSKVGSAGYELTVYGRQFLLYLRRNHRTMMVI